MDVIVFKHAIVSRTSDGDVLFALTSGEEEPHGGRCLGLFLCRPEIAEALWIALGSTLKDE